MAYSPTSLAQHGHTLYDHIAHSSTSLVQYGHTLYDITWHIHQTL
jgi:hypothetical protein